MVRPLDAAGANKIVENSMNATVDFFATMTYCDFAPMILNIFVFAQRSARVMTWSKAYMLLKFLCVDDSIGHWSNLKDIAKYLSNVMYRIIAVDFVIWRIS